MRGRTGSLLAAFFLLAVAVALTRCAWVDPVAPPGTTIGLWANPTEIAIIGGISQLTIIATDENGYPVPNGTVIQMISDLGRLDATQVEMVDGTAHNRLSSEGDGGVATVQAFSGADAEGGAQQATVNVTIGIPVGAVAVSANPNYLPAGGGESEITAVVFDEDYVPVSSVYVSLTTSAGYLRSGAAPLITDDQGEVHDLLTTDQTATVTAAVGGGGGSDAVSITGSVTVEVDNRFADTLILEANPASITTCEGNADQVILTAHCLDVSGFPAEGAIVVFSLDGIGRLSSTSGIADSNGLVVITFDLTDEHCTYCGESTAICTATVTASSGTETAATDQVTIDILF